MAYQRFKKVALVVPASRRGYRFTSEPLNIGFIASFLEKYSIEVIIIDELAGQDLEKELLKYNPNLVGVTATTPLAPRAYEIAKVCRSAGITTVMGGVHASVLPEEALQHFDIVVVGEGEAAMLDIVRNNIQSGIVTAPFIRDIDEIPPPARHLIQMDFYFAIRNKLLPSLFRFAPFHARVASMLTSRGCPYSCIFCYNSWKGIPFRFNSAERVISEVKELMRVYGVSAIFFIEDDFFANKPRFEKICELLIEEKLNLIWGANARVDDISENILRIAKEAGCREVVFGFESASQRILDILNKKTTVEQNYKAVELCYKVGISPQGTVMFGNPTETLEDIRATQRFLWETRIKGVGVMITTPYPGTVLWDWCKEHSLMPSEVMWENLDHTSNLVIPACNTISQREIEKLKFETEAVIVGGDPLRLLTLIAKGLIPPKDIVRLLRNPLAVLHILMKVFRSLVGLGYIWR